MGSKLYQTKVNPDDRAHHPPTEFVADDSFHEDGELEDAEGDRRTIAIVVDPPVGKYYVVMPGLSLDNATFAIELP